MKKILLTLACVLAAGAAFAQGTLTTDQSNFNISGTSGSFDVTFNLTTNANNISSFDLFLDSNSTGANAFTITNTTPVFAASDSAPAANPQHPDPFATDANFAAATFVNGHDQGFSYFNATTPNGDEPLTGAVSLETLTISYSFGSAPAPGTTFSFSTTPSVNGGYKSTDFYSDSFATFNSLTPATFTVTVVPEPATWSLIALGGLGCLGLNILRRPRRS